MSKIAKSTDVSACESIDAMLQASQTDWDPETVDAGVSVTDRQGRPINGGGYRAIIRPDSSTALAFVGERYRVNSHRRQLAELEPFVRAGDLIPSNVSVWDNGALLAFQFRCPDLDMVIRGRDVVSPLLTLAFCYGFKLADSAFFSDFRWFCKNQLGQVAKVSTDRVKHRGDVVGRFGEVMGTRLAGLKGELADRYRAMRLMIERPLGGRALVEYVGASLGATPEEVDRAWVMPADELTGTAARIPEVLECYQVDTCDAEGTVWQAYNAVTRHQTHKVGHNDLTRARRMMFGAGQTVANQAFVEAARLVA